MSATIECNDNYRYQSYGRVKKKKKCAILFENFAEQMLMCEKKNPIIFS